MVFLVLLWSTVSMPTEGDFKALIQAQRVTIHNKNLYEVFGNKQLFCTAPFILFISAKIISTHKGQIWYSNFPLKIELTSLSQASRIFKKVYFVLSFIFPNVKVQKKKPTKENLNCLSFNDLMLLYNFVRKGHRCFIFLSEICAFNLKLLFKFFFFMKWTERSTSRELFGRTFIN